MESSEQEPEITNGDLHNNQQFAKPDVEKKKKKPGIIHLSYIPRYMTVKKVREHFSEFGEVTRLFLKPEKNKSGKPSKFFAEGWVEFAKRSIARKVAECLNGTQVGGKRHTPYYDALWCIKYLPKFQWGHLSEAKAYEKSRKEQKMRAEIAKVKKEIDSYTRTVSKRKKFKDIKSLKKDLDSNEIDNSEVSQTKTSLHHENISAAERQSLLLKKVFGNAEDT